MDLSFFEFLTKLQQAPEGEEAVKIEHVAVNKKNKDNSTTPLSAQTPNKQQSAKTPFDSAINAASSSDVNATLQEFTRVLQNMNDVHARLVQREKRTLFFFHELFLILFIMYRIVRCDRSTRKGNRYA